MRIQKLAFGMDFVPALNAIARQEELWTGDKITLRGISPQGQLVNWFTFDMLPDLRQYIFAVMNRVCGEVLGPVELRRLRQGETFEFAAGGYEHYVLVMHTLSGGLIFSFADEHIPSMIGDAIWIAAHGALVNNSQGEVIVLHVQLTPNSPATFVPA